MIPGVHEFVVGPFLAELRRGRELKEGAKRAAENGVVTRALDLRG